MKIIRFCNLCGGIIIKINRTEFGDRCIRCRSTFIHRAMGVVLKNLPIQNEWYVYELSAHGAIFKFLKKNFKHLTYSEYVDNCRAGTLHNGTLIQDVQNLTFQNETFDLVTSTEVFEHVPDDLSGFKEIHRVLIPGGYFVFTVPLTETEKTIERAKIVNGQLIHILDPEYHGDHLRGNGILAFRNYGLDIVSKLESAGFSEVKIHHLEDKELGIHKKQVIVAQK